MPRPWVRGFSSLFTRPFQDLFHGQARCLRRRSDLAWILVGLAAGWWLYVPLHELLHAAGCVLAGGTVERLQIQAIYGGGLLARIFPWVEAGGGYAGRLAGFGTGGNDWIYLATDLAPFVLAFFPGVWMLRLAARAQRPFAFGVLLPFALGPLLSLTGDAYEIGSLALVNQPAWAPFRELLLGDDLWVQAQILMAASAPDLAWVGFGLAAVVGVLWAFLTYAASSGLASLLGQRPLHAPAPVPRDEEEVGEETLYGQ